MGKHNSRKRRFSSESRINPTGWKKVDVGIEVDNINFKDFKAENHYDDTRLAVHADDDLEAGPSENAAIFFGLEVIDGSQYEILHDKATGAKKFQLKLSAEFKEDEHHNSTDTRSNETDTNKLSNAEKFTETSPTSKISTSEDMDTVGTLNTKKKKKKKEKKKKVSEVLTDNIDDTQVVRNQQPVISPSISNDELLLVQSQWMSATGGSTLHNILYESLFRNGWLSPTPIQSAVLPAAILGRRNIVGAAPTGSGKTLAFLLPIYQYLLEQQDQHTEDNLSPSKRRPLQALILTPTRELALQIHTEAQKLWKGQIGTLVGGLAVAKQQRVLEKNRPAVITATPGRLWELISSREHEHLNDLSHIKFLVIDEADRMIQQGSFPQLAQILDSIQRANPTEEDEDLESDDEDDIDGDDRLQGLPGIPGESKVTMLNDDILKQVEMSRELDPGQHNPNSLANEFIKGKVDNEMFNEFENNIDENVFSSHQTYHRQTFVFSATLTLPSSVKLKSTSKSKTKSRNTTKTVEGAIAEILEKARARGATKIVDLSNTQSSAQSTKKFDTLPLSKAASDISRSKDSSKVQFRLPDGLTFQEIKCTQLHKDSHLYAYLMTTGSGSTGPALVFCNSIAAVRRIGATLQTLGLRVRTLHAQMQQRARFRAVESLNEEKTDRTVVIATDVAARGLDIPSVAIVVHYDAARTVDTFVHRSGRTARGVGVNAVGLSLSLVSPNEDRFHVAVTKALQVQFNFVHLDGRLLKAAQERVNLASKVVAADDSQNKIKRQNQWFRDTAEEAGIELDDNCIDETHDSKEICEIQNAQTAKIRLKALLSQPMQIQRYGKFSLCKSNAIKSST